MISRYEKNQRQYADVLEYVNSSMNISEDIKKDMLETIEKYRICISCMEMEEIQSLVDKCAESNNIMPLQKQFHDTIFESSYCPDLVEEDEYEIDEYCLD